MTIFSKLSDIFSANLNSLLDKASDPIKLSKLMIQEMQETLVETKASTANVLAERKRIDRQLEEKLSKKAYFDEKAQMAVDKSREDLAQRILEQVLGLENEISDIQDQRDHLNGIIEEYRGNIEKLEGKLREARHKAKLLEERIKSSKQKKKVNEQLAKANGPKAAMRIEALEQQIDRLDSESEADGFGSKSSLEEEIADLENQGEIQKRMEALKRKSEADS
jgi:phage shock protein A